MPFVSTCNEKRHQFDCTLERHRSSARAPNRDFFSESQRFPLSFRFRDELAPFGPRLALILLRNEFHATL
ncbi:hypothetical protein RB1646 [Rhodopirellula baltica SH 1]|uniref:Uncharacterized protein n=1 Tax=Rhodopirellula baltica (strain DSM 10527 / NCIMB 13988 / SH1) TaxID=243090 RepID=Q7UX05_RHOBA|nr:hypothetical protein RB1646 [Rhodopirellula baltica SH 1]